MFIKLSTEDLQSFDIWLAKHTIANSIQWDLLNMEFVRSENLSIRLFAHNTHLNGKKLGYTALFQVKSIQSC